MLKSEIETYNSKKKLVSSENKMMELLDTHDLKKKNIYSMNLEEINELIKNFNSK